jgi:hypothetical protein
MKEAKETFFGRINVIAKRINQKEAGTVFDHTLIFAMPFVVGLLGTAASRATRTFFHQDCSYSRSLSLTLPPASI